ncbi:MAG: thioredoxin domain-containing protein [Candidatus Eisenbacteria bacterium]|nr:thioredoxin domain-containing protein [Candidatus Eisenbacteria bacterium]
MSAPNRLALEKSPYLLQHAHNPVDWYPWGEEAFARARAEDRPIFLSIGYATCHWCHVMERESFEDPEVAAALNAHFVCIKVDREERPDVDRVYMTAMQAAGMGGGWPLNVFLTPQLEPFYGGTYFPPRAVDSRPGMLELLPRVHEAWTNERAALVQQGSRVLAAVESLARAGGEAAAYDELARQCAAALERSFDKANGGFGGRPKFPSTVNLAFLLRWWARAPHERGNALDMVRAQLDAMRAGGLHDHLGGGFHRYSVDERWLVPHFEKMLYDQALIADAYLDAFHACGETAYADTARGVFRYLARDLTGPGGEFHSAEDADSEGEEGRFYVWTPAQLAGVLGGEEARLFALRYGVTPQGNFEHGASVLHEAHALDELARRLGTDAAGLGARLARARAALLSARELRPRPLRDDKVVTAWNGLAIASCARGARVLGEPALAKAAARAATFVWERLRDPAGGALRRRWREGEAAGEGQLDDYAFLARGMLELYRATFEPLWLERAVALTEAQIERFWDEHDGAFFESPAGDASVRVRMKDGFDGAEMAGNSVAAGNLVRLSALGERRDWRLKSRRLLDYYSRRLSGNAWAMPQMLVAMDLAAHPSRHVVVAGEPSPGRDALLAAARARFRPFDDLLVVDDASRERLSRLAPFAATLAPKDGRATGYVCVDRACRLPVTEPEAFAAQLDEVAPAGA